MISSSDLPPIPNPISIMNSFQDYQFRAAVDEALTTVRKILETTKHPARAADVPHVYDDKYGLVEAASKAALVATANALEVLARAARRSTACATGSRPTK